MKRIFKLSIKAISVLIIVFIIMTLIIALTKISSPRHVYIDYEAMSTRQRVDLLRRFGGDLTVTTFTSLEDLKREVTNYYRNLFRGELGYIYKPVREFNEALGVDLTRYEPIEPITNILKIGLARSIKLLGSALGIALILGPLKGVYDSKKEKKSNSTLKLFTTVIGLSLPVIFIATLLQFILVKLNFKYGIRFPVFGHQSLKHMLLPLITLTIMPTMYIARLTAVAIDKAYKDEYVRTALSKGSSKLRVLWIHVFRNAILQITDSIPTTISLLISDLVLVEYLFNYEGLTHTMMKYYDMAQSDVVTAVALVLCSIFILFYILLKIMRFALEPRGRSSAL